MEREKTIEVLNALVTINNDRIEGYETARKETEELDLKALFSEFLQTSNECKAELEAEVLKMGGKPSESTKNTGKFFRVWMDVKAALTGKDRKAILSSCEFGEDHALEEYKKAMEKAEYLSADQMVMVNAQYTRIKKDHDTIREMRDALKVADKL